MIVYGTGYSPFVRKVLVALAEKGVSYEHRPVHVPRARSRISRPRARSERSPPSTTTASGSPIPRAILWYLERKHPTPGADPADPKALGRAVWFDKFGDTELFGRS